MPAFIIALAVAAALPAGVVDAERNPAVAAERAFARSVAARGLKRGFLDHAAPGAFMFAPDARPVPDIFAGAPEAVETPPLRWWPEFAGLAASGEFGFTTGSASVPTRYFTVWRRQADGGWKWIYDGGAPLAAPMPPPGDRPVASLGPSTAAAGSAAAALAELAPVEAAIAAAAATRGGAALVPHLLPNGLVGGPPAPTWPGRAGQGIGIAQRAAALTLEPLGGEASEAGDMAFTWGRAVWAGGRGHYVRLWQKHRAGWGLAVDLLLPTPPPPPATPAATN